MSRLIYAATDKCEACQDKKPYAQGLCHGCYDRVRKHGTAERRYGGTVWEIAWRNIEIDDETECWLWRGSVAGNGYGQVMFKAQIVVAHRFMFEHIGKRQIPEGLVLDHLCRNIICCNPEHLEPVTQLENVRRGLVPGLRCGHDPQRSYKTWHKSNNGKHYLVNKCNECSAERARRTRERKAMANGLR